MKELFKNTGLVIAGLALLIGLGWLGAGNNLAMMKVFAPATEQVRRETFEQSKSYRDGQLQELRSMQFAYIRAAPEHKAALAGMMRHRMAAYPVDQLPADLYQLFKEIQ